MNIVYGQYIALTEKNEQRNFFKNVLLFVPCLNYSIQPFKCRSQL